jgi:hypothetical protein
MSLGCNSFTRSMMNPAQQPEPELAVSSKDWAPPKEEGTVLGKVKAALTYSLTVDIHEVSKGQLYRLVMHPDMAFLLNPESLPAPALPMSSITTTGAASASASTTLLSVCRVQLSIHRH